MEQRNIVLITWDSVRADHCSCYGYSKETTPFLDSLARKGLKFENAIVSGLPTPVSMGGIFTSKYCSSSKVKGKTLADVLKKSGYSTGAFHSNPFASRFYGFNKGFDVFKDYIIKESDKEYMRSSNFSRKIITKIIIKSGLNIERFRFYYNLICVLIKNKYDVGLKFNDFYNDVIDWIGKQDTYFLWVLLIDTHFPYVPESMSRLEKIRSMIAYDSLYSRGLTHRVDQSNIDKNKVKLVIKAYDQCISEADKMTKRFWNDIKDTDPIFIIHADHGEAFGEHGFFGHPPEHYEYLIRVPLIIYNADVRETIKKPTSLLKLAPTICDLVKIPNEFSVSSLFKEKYTPPIVENELESGLRVTVRDEEWKLIANPDRDHELYNIRQDPMELENLADQEPDVKRELEKYVRKHIRLKSELIKLNKRIRKLKI